MRGLFLKEFSKENMLALFNFNFLFRLSANLFCKVKQELVVLFSAKMLKILVHLFRCPNLLFYSLIMVNALQINFLWWPKRMALLHRFLRLNDQVIILISPCKTVGQMSFFRAKPEFLLLS